MISIIDDDEAVRTATASLLRSFGFGTCTFASAEDFLGSPRRNDTACVVTDVQMTGMSGVELQQHLRNAGSALPLIFMTAFPEDGVRRQALAGGASGFFAKPFDAVEFIACVTAALRHPA